MSKILAKYRQKAVEAVYHDYSRIRPWQTAVLESIFRPKQPKIPGKGTMEMLHPDHKNLHIPGGMYIADWRKYKVEDHPALVKFQERCHRAGLHDPFLRNDAFLFLEGSSEGAKTKWAVLTQQCMAGLAVALVMIGISKVYCLFRKPYYKHSDEYWEKWGPEGKPAGHH